jgi:hypothetical protein
MTLASAQIAGASHCLWWQEHFIVGGRKELRCHDLLSNFSCRFLVFHFCGIPYWMSDGKYYPIGST